MGILSSYVENGTKLKSLKFGNDNSFTSEPFIVTPLPSDTDVVTKPQTSLAAYSDGVTRGSLLSIKRAAQDVTRLTKYMASPSGIKFTLKQNLLSRVSPETETSGKFLNEGIYTPLSTLAQAGVGILGLHLNKQGLDPTGLTSLSIKKYGEVVYNLGKNSNRLVTLYKDKINQPTDPDFTNLRSYKGGPGSLFGLGNTDIKFATTGDGNLPLRIMGSNDFNPKTYLVPGKGNTSIDDVGVRNEIKSLSEKSFTSPILNYLPSSSRQLLANPQWFDNTYNTVNLNNESIPLGTYSSKITLHVDPIASDATPSQKYDPLNQGNRGYLANLNKNVGYFMIQPGVVGYDDNFLNGAARNIGPDFRKVDRKVRGFDDPENRYDHITTPSGRAMEMDKGDYFTMDQAKKVVDRIYYTSDSKRTSTPFGNDNDLIDFHITIVSPTNGEETLRFRAYIDNMSDSYSPEWNSQTYMGRGEKLYKYNSFDRKISLGFTVAAEGTDHLGIMYNYLNILASSLAPTYTPAGYMAGNIHKLTVGNYINQQYGIINGLTYDIMEESPWEIDSGKQLPFYIKVTGFQFTPIHDFRPSYKATGKFINQYGKHNRNIQDSSVKDIPPSVIPQTIPSTP